MQPVSRGERAALAAKFEPETDASQILSREAYPSEDLLRLYLSFLTALAGEILIALLPATFLKLTTRY